MKHRDSPILAYYSPQEDTIYCRICVYGGYFDCDDIDASHIEKRCCSYNNTRVKWIGEDFKFDNSRHTIVVSETKCILCNYANKTCTKDTPHGCHKFIFNYTKNCASKIDGLPRGKPIDE